MIESEKIKEHEYFWGVAPKTVSDS